MASSFQGQYANWKAWDEGRFGESDRAMSRYFGTELARSGYRDLGGVRILEIGFGNGEFAMWATGRGAVYSGTEQLPALVERGKMAGLDVHPAERRLGEYLTEGTVDVVIALDVIEHLEQDLLARLLEEVRPYLKPAGRFIARTPSGDSPFSGPISHGDLTHRTILGSSAVAQLALRTGFDVVETRAPSLPLTGLGIHTLTRRVLVSFVRGIGHHLIRRIFMGSDSAVLSPNMMVILQKTE